VRVRFQSGKQWSAAVGIDNLNNALYWNVHPYPMRTFLLELKYEI
jgi:iron complex outermembrane receptor protein